MNGGTGTQSLVLRARAAGLTIIPANTPLTRLNYFDGKFLRAADLKTEQRYLQQLVALSNQADGPGVAYGFDLSLAAGDNLRVSAGLAVDPEGRVLQLPGETVVSISQLIERSRETLVSSNRLTAASGAFGDCVEAAATPPDGTVPARDLYLITIAHAEAFCGEEDVYGKLCEEACVTSTDRPYLVEGVVIRAVPLVLRTPFTTSGAVALTRAHLRSLVAGAYFADERNRIGSLISGAGLRSDAWCFGAQLLGGRELPIGVLSRDGASTVFLDAWIARRERMDTSARRYWQYRMAMRPWDIFLAQVLQFQCQLRDAFRDPGPGSDDDPCNEARRLISEATTTMDEVTRFFAVVSSRLVDTTTSGLPTVTGGLAHLSDLQRRFFAVRETSFPVVQQRILINRGFASLPPAGYLPVTPGAIPVNTQVRQLLGEGLDLRFCAVRPSEFVAHALEEAQHLPRISLLQGLDDPENRPPVDILVPEGEIVHTPVRPSGRGFETLLHAFPTDVNATTGAAATSSTDYRGVTRMEVLPSGGGALHFAGAAPAPPAQTLGVIFNAVTRMNAEDAEALQNLERRPFAGASVSSRLTASLHSLNAEAVRFAARLRPGAGIFADRRPTDNIFVPSRNPPERLMTFWTTMRCERNALNLDVGDTTGVELRVLMTAPLSQPFVLDAELRGTLQVEQRVITSGLGRRIRARIRGLYSQHIVVSGQSRDTTGPFDTTATAQFRPPSSGRDNSLEVTLPLASGNRYTITATWADATPLSIEARVNITIGQITVPLGIANLNANDDVLLPTNSMNQAARAALNVAGAALGDPGFAEAAARLLFPQAPPAPPETTIRPTLDWVLFHHRRIKECADIVDRPAPAAERTYRVFHLLFEASEDLTPNELRDALRTNDVEVLGGLGFVEVDLVQFASLSSSLASDPDVVRQDWRNAGPGDELVYGGIASLGSASDEGTALAQARLESLQRALAPVTPLYFDATLEVLPSVLTPLPAGPDGMIVLVTVTTRSVCHTVFRIPNEDVWEIVLREIRNGNIAEVLSDFQPLQEVLFRATTDEVLENSLDGIVERWNTQGGGFVFRMAVVSREGDTTSTPELLIDQGTRIHRALPPATFVTTEHVISPAALPVECPAITLLLPIGQTGPAAPFGFTLSSTPVTIAPTGIQTVADAVLNGTGGVQGQQSIVNVTAFVPTNIINPLSALPALVIDDPAPGSEQLNVNLFLGNISGNSVTFTGVPLVRPGTGNRRFRIRNVIINAGALGTGGTTPGGQVIMVVSIAPSVPISPGQVLVAVVGSPPV